MKKLIAAAVSAMALASMAAMEEVAKLRFADADGLVAAVAKIGEMSGNGMIGVAAAAQVNELEIFKFFGTARPGASIAMSFLADGEKLDKGLEAFGDSLGVVVLYPINGKAEFLSKHPGSVETNGVVFVQDDSCDMFDETYLAFSPDGKWVAASDKADLAKTGLGLASAASKPMGADLVKVRVGEKSMKLLLSVLEKASAESAAKGEELVSKKDLEYLKGFASLAGSIRVGSSGIDFLSRLGVVKGSEADKIGSKPLAKDALAFAGENAVSAVAAAEGSGGADAKEVVDVVVSALAKRGVKLDFLGLKSAPGRVTLDLDIPALVKYVQGEGAAAFSKIDPEELIAELRPALEAATSKTSPSAGPAFSGATSIKGFKPKFSAAARLAKTLPEAARKPVYGVSACSIYSIVKGVVPQVVATLPAEAAGQAKPLLAALPDEGQGGIAQAWWRDGAAHVGIARISADEIRGIGATVNAVMGLVMANAMSAMQDASDTDDEDPDDED